MSKDPGSGNRGRELFSRQDGVLVTFSSSWLKPWRWRRSDPSPEPQTNLKCLVLLGARFQSFWPLGGNNDLM